MLTLTDVLAMCPEPAPVDAICPACDTPYGTCPHHYRIDGEQNHPRLTDAEYHRAWCRLHGTWRASCYCRP